MADQELVDMIFSGYSKSADLRNADLRNANLEGVDFRSANLRGANLKNAELEGANFRDASLQIAILQRADLTNVDLRGTNLQYADFTGAILKGANLLGADLRGADLSDTDLVANLQGVKYDASTIWPRGFKPPAESRMASRALANRAAKSNPTKKTKKTKIVEMIMSGEGAGADLRKVNLKGADLKGANLRRTDFRDANLQGADLEGANLRNVLLEGANLQVANLTKANLSGSDLSRVKFRDVELRNADLRGAYLNDANFYSSDLNKANLSGATLSGANFKLSDLRGAILDDIKYDDSTKWPRGFTPPAESRMASRRSRMASQDDSTMISTFTFSIPLVWETYGGELMADSPAAKGKRISPSERLFFGEDEESVVRVSYDIPKAGKMSIRVMESIPPELLPPKQKVNHEETDDMLFGEISTYKKLVRPDDITEGIYVNGFDVDDMKGEYIALLNRRTGMVMVVLMNGLQRAAMKDNLRPSKITGSGFMVPKDAFRLIYKGIPELTLEQFPEVLEAALTKVEVDVDADDYGDDYGGGGEYEDFPY